MSDFTPLFTYRNHMLLNLHCNLIKILISMNTSHNKHKRVFEVQVALTQRTGLHIDRLVVHTSLATFLLFQWNRLEDDAVVKIGLKKYQGYEF